MANPLKYVKKLYRSVLSKSSPAIATKIQFLRVHGRLPNLRKPKTFSEKVCASKLNWQDERFVALSDKVAVKRWVAEILGDDWIIPTLFAGDRLPPVSERTWPEPFVIKANHGSGLLHIARSKSDLDWPHIDRKIDGWLKKDWPKELSEEWYNHIQRKVLVEPMIGEDGVPPPDFKFFVFRGEIAGVS